MDEVSKASMSDRDWIDKGKGDAWAGKSRQPPDDPRAASMYELGYCEGEIERPPTQPSQE